MKKECIWDVMSCRIIRQPRGIVCARPNFLVFLVDEERYPPEYENADRQMMKVCEALTRSSFYDNTIVIFTSDHGELLGAHGNLHQKWYCAYEEVIHVPFVIHHRGLFPQPQHTDMLTSSADLLPTLLGLSNIDTEEIRGRLHGRFSEARPLVGRNLAPLITGQSRPSLPDEPIYFMTDDDVTRGQHQANPLGMPYPSVRQPNHVETVMATLDRNGSTELWKLSRYFDNTQFWNLPGQKDVISQPVGNPACGQPRWVTQVKTQPLPSPSPPYGDGGWGYFRARTGYFEISTNPSPNTSRTS
ncbi:sulfatase-like hydrolase/transferase [Paenibacillus thiaminolyticus]|uniref:Sulfatase N-terminal domain-containing protein n=1 Tax=Paenibacillus thiaminolyticus TaxID=49283 RepID=A0A3A3GKD3_PANTH|nr:sulfatase-like hydrolase/transferase [Paenibacillus thiaminolyticus]RJG23779.1 hypothetical protein DQX05_12200 [Paenibacillus thiaminolyticus]